MRVFVKKLNGCAPVYGIKFANSGTTMFLIPFLINPYTDDIRRQVHIEIFYNYN